MSVISRQADLTEINVNIDDLLDVFWQTQKKHGIDVGLIEVGWDFDQDGHLHKLCDSSSDGKSEDVRHIGATDNGSITIGNQRYARLGSFADYQSPEIDEDGGEDCTYICEYCSELGYKKEYKSYICDSCTACESCSEYESGDCSGCTFSSYRTGRTYKEEIEAQGGNIGLDPDEQAIIDSIDDINYEPVRECGTGFTVLDYDH